jgi:hypothetical protein
MPSYTIAFSIIEATAPEEAALQVSLAAAGFLTTVVGSHRVTYRLPPAIYHCTGALSKDEVFEAAKRIAFRTKKRCRIVVVEEVGSSWVGLDMVGRQSASRKIFATDSLPVPPALAVAAAAFASTQAMTLTPQL